MFKFLRAAFVVARAMTRTDRHPGGRTCND
jgi:hypothetical protein